jgi:hypothetical protein
MTRARTPQALSIVVAASLVSGCATASPGVRPAPFPGSPAIPEHPVSILSVIPLDVPRLVQMAVSLQGSPYLFGGESPATGFDCSGLVRYLFREQGWELPRTVREQFEYGKKVDVQQIQPGDLLFFATESNGASHVGIAIDAAVAPDARSGRAFIHAPGANGAVRIDMLETNYWRSRFLGARRLF